MSYCAFMMSNLQLTHKKKIKPENTDFSSDIFQRAIFSQWKPWRTHHITSFVLNTRVTPRCSGVSYSQLNLSCWHILSNLLVGWLAIRFKQELYCSSMTGHKGTKCTIFGHHYKLTNATYLFIICMIFTGYVYISDIVYNLCLHFPQDRKKISHRAAINDYFQDKFMCGYCSKQ